MVVIMVRGHKDLAEYISSSCRRKIISVLHIVIAIIIFITIIAVAVVIVSADPGPTYRSVPINASAGGTDNQSEWIISVEATAAANETINLSINETDPNYDYVILKNASFSEDNFTLPPSSTKNVTLTLTIYDGTTPENYTIKVDCFSLEEGWPEFMKAYTSTILYIEVQSTIDTTAPDVTAITLNQWYANNSVVTLNVSINDSQSGVKNATVNVSAINSTLNEVVLVKQGGDYWTNTTIVADRGDTGGLVNLTITAYDNVSNCNNTVNMTVGITVDDIPPTITIDTPTTSSPVYRKGGELFYVNFTYTELNPQNYTVEVRNCTAVINSSLNESVVVGTNLFANHSFNLNSTASDG
ncbi:MAG: hypothetical protein PHI16_02950, partial [Methanocellales archaeon]|nr:hypothetical protein [Methanocellales archaeon]